MMHPAGTACGKFGPAMLLSRLLGVLGVCKVRGCNANSVQQLFGLMRPVVPAAACWCAAASSPHGIAAAGFSSMCSIHCEQQGAKSVLLMKVLVASHCVLRVDYGELYCHSKQVDTNQSPSLVAQNRLCMVPCGTSVSLQVQYACCCIIVTIDHCIALFDVSDTSQC